MRDPYIVLGVARRASEEEIARAYRRQARASHPDSGSAGSAERFQAVTDAYEVLRDPRRRAVYDRSHLAPGPLTAAGRGGSVRYAAPGSRHLVLGRASVRDIDLNATRGGLLDHLTTANHRTGGVVWRTC